MNLFRRNKTISIDLKGNKLEECINYPEYDGFGLQEFYLKEIFNPNHIQIATTGRYIKGLHDFVYNEAQKQILIKSKFKKSTFGIYLYLLMPVIAFVGAEGNHLKIVCLGLIMFVFITLGLSLGIKSESKKIEFGFMQQVNYFKRNNRRIAKK
jgi:hypothetical protein